MGNLDRFLSQQEAFAESVGSRRSQVMKRARWEKRGDYYLRGSTVPRGSLVQVDTDVQRMAFNWITQVRPDIAESVNRHMVPVAENAFNMWPVKTGLSKSLLALTFGISPNGDEFTTNIINRAPYAFYINKSRDVRELIFKPGEIAADQMAREILGDLGE